MTRLPVKATWKENLRKLEANDVAERERARAYFANLDQSQALLLVRLAKEVHNRVTKFFGAPLAGLPIVVAIFSGLWFLSQAATWHWGVLVVGFALVGALLAFWVYTIVQGLPLERRLSRALIEVPKEMAVNALPHLLLDPQHYSTGAFRPREDVIRALVDLMDDDELPIMSVAEQEAVANYIKMTAGVAHYYPVLREALPTFVWYLSKHATSLKTADELQKASRIAGFRRNTDLAANLDQAVQNIKTRGSKYLPIS